MLLAGRQNFNQSVQGITLLHSPLLICHLVVYCFVFSASCLVYWSPYWERGSWLLVALLSFGLVCGMFTFCHSLFAFPLGVIGRLGSVILALPGHLYCLQRLVWRYQVTSVSVSVALSERNYFYAHTGGLEQCSIISLSKYGLFLKERICSLWEQNLSFKSSPYLGSDEFFPLRVAPMVKK